MRRGQRILVTWYDVTAQAAGDPKDAELVVWRDQPGVFWGYKLVPVGERRVRCLLLANAEGEDGDWSQTGWTCIPATLIAEITEIEDAR